MPLVGLGKDPVNDSGNKAIVVWLAPAPCVHLACLSQCHHLHGPAVEASTSNVGGLRFKSRSKRASDLKKKKKKKK